jgi:hypothetical protein
MLIWRSIQLNCTIITHAGLTWIYPFFIYSFIYLFIYLFIIYLFIYFFIYLFIIIIFFFWSSKSQVPLRLMDAIFLSSLRLDTDLVNR